MSFDILFLASGHDTSTKGLMVKALTAHGPLTIMQLQQVLRREFQKKISYQAIRQALCELHAKVVIEKQGKYYTLSKQWVEELRNMVVLLEHSLRRQKDIRILDKSTTQINLTNLDELGHFILYSLEQKYFNVEQGDEIFMQLAHLWIPFANPEKRRRLEQLMKQSTIHVAVKSKSAGDLVLSYWYKRFVDVHLGMKFMSSCDYIVHEDTVVQIYLSQALRKKMNIVYSLKGLVSLKLLDQLAAMTFTEYGIPIIITKNREIADQIRQNIRVRINL